MGTVMGVMLALMLAGVLVWGRHHGMTDDHDQGGHAEKAAVEKTDASCPTSDCVTEELKENVNPDDAEEMR
ncbi:MAG: hypothetical protein IT362_11525 [Deltaproteobacteria bacterium]|nr:hypothetical protein [Deltaproteobacteria bacterium]